MTKKPNNRLTAEQVAELSEFIKKQISRGVIMAVGADRTGSSYAPGYSDKIMAGSAARQLGFEITMVNFRNHRQRIMRELAGVSVRVSGVACRLRPDLARALGELSVAAAAAMRALEGGGDIPDKG